MVSVGVRNGKYTIQAPGYLGKYDQCDTRIGFKRGSCVQSVIASPSCDYKRAQVMEYSIKTTYATFATLGPQIGVDLVTTPPSLWSTALYSAGFNYKGREYIKAINPAGAIGATVSYDIDFPTKCAGYADDSPWKPTLIRIRLSKRQFKLRDDCQSTMMASETITLIADPMCDPAFLSSFTPPNPDDPNSGTISWEEQMEEYLRTKTLEPFFKSALIANTVARSAIESNVDDAYIDCKPYKTWRDIPVNHPYPYNGGLNLGN